FQTRSGGLHLWMQHRDGVKNTQSKIALGIDTRGEGGYVIYWYATGTECLDQAPPAPWPTWLLAEIQPPPSILWQAYPSTGNDNGGGRLDGVLRRLRNAGEGERNTVMFWGACRCVEMQLPQTRIEAELIPAALNTGLPEAEIRRTIASACRRAAT